MRIDLHLHSTASDGTDDPAAVMSAAAGAGLGVAALTDHDTAAGWGAAAERAVRLGMAFVPGTEVSCTWQSANGGVSVHLLSYLHDPDDVPLAEALARTRGDRVSRARRMVDLIAADHELAWDDVLEHVPAGATVGRPHIADAMVARGLVASRDEAFAHILRTGSPYHVSHWSPDVLDAVRLVRAAGGVPVMAHPLAGRRGRTVPESVIAAMADAGLAGLEVDHRDHLPAERERLRGLAGELGLLATGSSDYHGTGKQNRVGENLTDPEVFAAIEAAGTGRAVVRP